jgi:CheY-like chemotaxis protein/c-di-GMP-binding flagellar brake protein YcgR
MARLKVLIAEDEEEIVALYRVGLGSGEFEKKFADNAVRVLAIYEYWAPEVIVLDMTLPYLDSAAIVKEIREGFKDRTTPIIVVGPPSETEAMRECAKFGVQGVLAKPFSASRLGARILDSALAARNPGALQVTDEDIERAMAAPPGAPYEAVSEPPPLPSEIGMELSLLVEGAPGPIKSFLVGAVRGRFLLVQAPEPKKPGHALRSGAGLTVVYTSGEAIYCFECTVCGAASTPTPILFLTYPGKAERYELRADRRISCYMPADVTFGDTAFKGVMLDMSCRGCRLNAPLAAAGALRALKGGDVVHLSVERVGNLAPETLEARIRNIRRSSTRISFGLEFISKENAVLAALDALDAMEAPAASTH